MLSRRESKVYKMQLSIVPVTAENRSEVSALHVASGQEGFIETVAQCLEEAREQSVWNPVGIYADEIAVGFSMYGYWPRSRRAWLDRLLIDGRYQHRGYGRAAVRLLLERIREEYPDCRDILLSVYADNPRAARLYEQFGFTFNGEKDVNGEDVMILHLSQEEHE